MEYKTFKEDGLVQEEIKKSRFLCHVKRVYTEEEARDFIAAIKKEHYKATHNCSAFVIGEQFEIKRTSDDGEPSGTAGVPMLGVLENHELTNVCCVVTRYFGGIKLGAGGLIRAYAGSVAQAVKEIGLVEIKEQVGLGISLTYPLIYLTATSTEELDKKVKKQEIKRVSLPRRFHGNPLVVPKKVWLKDLRKKVEKKQVPTKLLKLIKEQRKTSFPLILFVSEIELGEKILILLRRAFKNEIIELVTSKTDNRLELVEKFRNQEITILVSTTILERGVTFPKVDVFVIEANHRLFTKSALVQIAGRVGRSMERPTGELLYLAEGSSKEMMQAIKEIKEMNREAGF